MSKPRVIPGREALTSTERNEVQSLTRGPIVVNIPGARLLSSELSKNARIDPRAKASIVRRHRDGGNLHTARAIANQPGYRMVPAIAHGRVVWSTAPDFKARRVTFTRICPAMYMADGDNASTLLSATRDGVADALGVNDRVFVDNPTDAQIKSGAIGVTYNQIVGPWGIRITIES